MLKIQKPFIYKKISIHDFQKLFLMYGQHTNFQNICCGWRISFTTKFRTTWKVRHVIFSSMDSCSTWLEIASKRQNRSSIIMEYANPCIQILLTTPYTIKVTYHHTHMTLNFTRNKVEYQVKLFTHPLRDCDASDQPPLRKPLNST